MRTITAALLAVLLLASAASAQESTAAFEKAALTAATAWLGHVDSLRYDESWDTAAAMFKAAVPRDKWVGTASAVRSPLGAVKSRTVQSSKYTTTLPGAPDGEYVVIQFDTVFANKKAAVETVVTMKEKDGAWKVSGYFVK